MIPLESLNPTNFYTVIKPDNDERRVGMFKDSKLRLLMSLVGFERLGIEDEPDATWIIPSATTSTVLQETHDIVERHKDNPIMLYGDEDPVNAEDLLRRKNVARSRKAEFDDDSDGDGIVSGDEEEFLFPAGGPTNRKSNALNELKKKRRKRIRDNSDDEGGLDDETIEARRKARLLADLEKRRKIKSEEFVRDSDDEDDEERDREFFAREELRGKTHAQKVLDALKLASINDSSERESGKSRKRKSAGAAPSGNKRVKSTVDELDSEDDEEMLIVDASSSSPTRDADPETSDEDEDADADETPLSSPHTTSSPEHELHKSTRVQSPPRDSSEGKHSTIDADADNTDEDEDEAPVTSSSSRMRRARGNILDESDSE